MRQWSEIDHFENSQNNIPIRSGIKINHPLLPDVGVLQKTADANMMFISNIPAVGNIAHACGVHQKSNGQMLYPV